MQSKAYAVVSAWQEISGSDGSEGALHAVGHAKHGWVHGACDTEGGEDGLRKRTYADAYAEGWRDADADWGAVDGGLLVVLVLHDDLVRAALGRCAGWRAVERGWWRVAVDVGVVGDVGVPGCARHWGWIGLGKEDEMCEVGGFESAEGAAGTRLAAR
jgi:hypothetical protein